MRCRRPTGWIVLGLLLITVPASLLAQSYEVDQRESGPIAFEIRGATLNENSSLMKQSVLMNDPESPIQLDRHEGTFDYEDRRFVYEGSVSGTATDSVQAYEIRHALYDVFGDHLENLSNTVIRDHGSGSFTEEGSWRILDQSDVVHHRITVSYVARARLADGTIWTYDRNELVSAIAQLDLEGQLEGEDDEDEDNELQGSS